MIKRFFITLLGSLTAIWITIGLLVALFFTMVAGVIAGAMSTDKEVAEVPSKAVLLLDLNGTIVERAFKPSFTDLLMGDTEEPQILADLVAAIDAARDDDRIQGLYILGNGLSAGSATFGVVRQTVERFRESGKWVVSYSDSYTQGDYYICSAADSLLLNPVGSVHLQGLAVSMPFYTGLLDKLGVKMQVLKVGTFKSAVEPYILKEMSEPNRRQYGELLSSMWKGMTQEMGASRKVSVEEINLWADSMLMTDDATSLRRKGVVTALKYRHEADDVVRKLLKTKKEDYKKALPTISVDDYLTAATLPHQSGKKEIAVYVAAGEIYDGEKNNLADGIYADNMVKDLRNLAQDKNVAGVVLRVNSPGGSAFASEQIWEAVEQLKKSGKPVYVSMGDYAASGGYYISCGADRIFAQPMTLTGSIGIYGMIPDAQGLISDKLGVNFDFVTTNANGGFPSIVKPMTPFQHAKMQAMINQGYKLFTTRCAQGRHMPLPKLLQIAEGRVWSGTSALQLGLVDEIGTLDDAVAAMAEKLNLDEYRLTTYPFTGNTFWQMLQMVNGQMSERSMRSELGPLYPAYRELKSLATRNPRQARMLLEVSMN